MSGNGGRDSGDMWRAERLTSRQGVSLGPPPFWAARNVACGVFGCPVAVSWTNRAAENLTRVGLRCPEQVHHAPRCRISAWANPLQGHCRSRPAAGLSTMGAGWVWRAGVGIICRL